MLLDDELPGLSYLRILCEQFPSLEVVRAFNDPLTLLRESEKLDFDLCILDIEMPGLNGIQVAQLLKGKPVIFTTAYNDYASEAYDLDAIDYLRKPIKKERFEKAIQKALQLLKAPRPGKRFVQINTSLGKALLFFDQLLYISTSETDKRDKRALLDTGEELVLKNISFEQLLQLLPPDDFCRINKSEVIALRAVRFFTKHYITVSLPASIGTDNKLVLSDIYQLSFLEKTKHT